MRVKFFAVLPLMLAMAACSTTQVAMPYAPTVSVQPASGGAPTVAVSDQVANLRTRGQEDPRWVGAIRGGYGNPLKVLTSPEPIDRVVARAFADALTARGLGAAPGGRSRYLLSITIHDFYANQLARREAMADFTVVLSEAATGREVWRDREQVHHVDGNIFTTGTGIFASTDELLQVTVRTMNQAIDRLLDKQEFRAALTP